MNDLKQWGLHTSMPSSRCWCCKHIIKQDSINQLSFHLNRYRSVNNISWWSPKADPPNYPQGWHTLSKCQSVHEQFVSFDQCLRYWNRSGTTVWQCCIEWVEFHLASLSRVFKLAYLNMLFIWACLQCVQWKTAQAWIPCSYEPTLAKTAIVRLTVRREQHLRPSQAK